MSNHRRRVLEKKKGKVAEKPAKMNKAKKTKAAAAPLPSSSAKKSSEVNRGKKVT